MATQDLNQLYQTAMDAFKRTSRFDKGMSRTAPFGYGDVSTATPEQRSASSTAPYGYGNINEYWNKPEYVINQAERLGLMPSGIATLPAATNIVPSTDPTQDEFLQQKQAAWRAQNPEPAMMPAFQIIGTDLPASQAAGHDVPLRGGGKSVGPEGMPYMPTLDQLAQMDAIKLKIDAGTATQEDIDLFNQLNFGRPLLPGEQGVFAGGGIVGLNYLTRGL